MDKKDAIMALMVLGELKKDLDDALKELEDAIGNKNIKSLINELSHDIGGEFDSYIEYIRKEGISK